mmetsp:Transcript_49122/g.55673  ORF Transcript_49122/g.55673 Transcript_49122/m.55673 type:complete len:90 (+) Transcript_49122:59-328(+)
MTTIVKTITTLRKKRRTVRDDGSTVSLTTIMSTLSVATTNNNIGGYSGGHESKDHTNMNYGLEFHIVFQFQFIIKRKYEFKFIKKTQYK